MREFGQIDDGLHCQGPPHEDGRIHKSTFHIQGAYSWEFELYPGDPHCFSRRSEAAVGSSNGIRTYHEGDDLWTAWQSYLPSRVNGTRYRVGPGMMQLEKPYCGGTPHGIIRQQDNRWESLNNSSVRESTAHVVSDRWIPWLAHIHYSANPAKGLIDLYLDPKDGSGFHRVLHLVNSTTSICPNGRAMPYQRFGIYPNTRWPAKHTVEYIDGFTTSDSSAAAQQNAFGRNYIPGPARPRPGPG